MVLNIATADRLKSTSVIMSKRKATSDQGLQPPKRKATGQDTVHLFLKESGPSGASGSSGAVASKPLTTPIPELFGIHIYSTIEIEGQTGLTKEYKKFWNVKAMEYCQHKRVTSKIVSIVYV